MTQVDTNQIVWAFTLVLAVYAGWLDARTRRIPNWLTVSGFVLGVGVNSILSGLHGTVAALDGAGLGLLILLPLVLMRAMGAGDWKLMGAIGSFVGPEMLLSILLFSVLVAGAMAIVVMVRARRVGVTMRNLAVLTLGFITFGFRPNPEISLDNPEALKLPFGVAVAIGTLICFTATKYGL